jgi:hypothetical protein
VNISSGICRGTRAASLGRYKPERSLRNGSTGLWYACARPCRASGNGLTIGPDPACRWNS